MVTGTCSHCLKKLNLSNDFKLPRPIPSEIVTEELERLINVLEAMSNDTSLLKKWYRKDTNKVIKMICI